MKNNLVILFDIDYTLFDVGKYRSLVFERFQELLPEVKGISEIAKKTYEEIRESGWFEIDRFTKQFLENITTQINGKILADVWRDSELLKESLYPEAEMVLRKLDSMNFILGIFSSGTVEFQKSKIDTISHFFKTEHVHIHGLKDEKFPEIITKYKGYRLILIDDYIPVLEKAKQTDKGMTTIWMKRGKLSQKVAPSDLYPPDFIVEDLEAILPLIERVS